MNFIKKLFIHSLAKYIILFCLGLILMLIYLLTNGFNLLINYMDATFIVGAAILICGGISLINYFGAYDFWGYAFSLKKQRSMNRSLYQYSEIMKGERIKKGYAFGPYFAVGAIFLVISVVISMFMPK